MERERAFAVLLAVLYGGATLYLVVYGLHLFILMRLFGRRRLSRGTEQRRRIERCQATTPDDRWPIVTTQVPLFNEAAVARRVLEAVAAMDYPAGRHEIQVLDDSTDETRPIVDSTAARLRAGGADITVLRRADRRGFKAGALAHGLAQARGEVIAVFDADFVPPRDFLRRAVPLLMDAPDAACVQGRWSHLNAGDSWLTRAQSIAIDGHFTVEQGGRAWSGLPLNFNGTAGVWRRAAIEDPAVGGWTADTLTEDLDLSYRAQLAGWRIEYCMDLACPAELPDTIPALKAQQQRWARGSMQTARKLLPAVWRGRFSNARRLEATLHLTAYSIAVWMLLLGLLCMPLHRWRATELLGDWIMLVWALAGISVAAPPAAYCYARRVLGGGWSGIRAVPYLMVLGAGLCLSNASAAVSGLLRRGGEFVRTPKSGGGYRAGGPRYRPRDSSFWMLELAAAAYCSASFVVMARQGDALAGAFLPIYAIGFAIVGMNSRPTRRRTAVDAAPRDQSVAVQPRDAARSAVQASRLCRTDGTPAAQNRVFDCIAENDSAMWAAVATGDD